MRIAQIDDKIMCKTRSGNKIYWMIASETGAPNFELRYIEIPPGGRSSYGRHPHEHEIFVIKGNGIVKGKDQQTTLSPGVAVYVAPDEEHQWINANDKEPFSFVRVVPRGAEAESKPPCWK